MKFPNRYSKSVVAQRLADCLGTAVGFLIIGKNATEAMGDYCAEA